MAAAKKHLFFLDFLRILACLMIIAGHFYISLQDSGRYDFIGRNIRLDNHLVSLPLLSVCLFFMMSGFGLTLSWKDRTFDPADYIKKRFTRVLLPFYLATVLSMAVKFFYQHEPPFPKTVHPASLLLTVLGLDTYATAHGWTENFGQGIGEWFLGALVILYAVFPFLLAAMKRHLLVTTGVLAAVWLVWIKLIAGNEPGINMDVGGIGFEFVLGMVLAFCYQAIPKWTVWLSGLLAVSAAAGFPALLAGRAGESVGNPLTMVITLIYGTAIFLLFLQLERILWKAGIKKTSGTRCLVYVSGLTYETFLIHHKVIWFFEDRLPAGFMTTEQLVRVALLELLAMIGAGLVIRLLEQGIRLLFSGIRLAGRTKGRAS